MSAEILPPLAVALTPREVADAQLRGATVAVIDVLRATSVIARALGAGATRVIPVATVEQATALHATLDRKHALLCGEREGKKIQGFHLGNSPLEYTPASVKDQTLIFCSTNGSQAMVRCLGAARQVMASFVNASVVADWLAAQATPLLIVCSGKLGKVCLEDTVMAGLLAEAVLEKRPELPADDGARMAVEMWRRWRDDIPRMLRASEHGDYLVDLGFEADLDFCAGRDREPVLPVLAEGQIELLRST